MHGKTNRQARVAAEIKRVVSELLLYDSFFDNMDAALVSIVDVSVSSSLQHVKIYFTSSLGTENGCLKFFKKHTYRIRRHIGTKIRLKFFPDLAFFIDESFNYRERIELLLNTRQNQPHPQDKL